ncbi:hypothetical protein OF83DRAFT_262949 [Amylostereum chailletii]|nr:hypothetical protein OF83DRAFT_262949 [Amylostereum chailletii]
MDRQIQDQSNASMPRAPTSSGRSTELSAARTRYSAPDSSSETFVPPIRVILPTPPRTLAPPEVQLRSLTTPLSSVYSPASTSISHKRPHPYLSPPSTSRKTRGPQLGSDPASPSTPKKPHKPLSSTSSGKRNRTYWQERNDGIELQRNVLPKHKQEESVPKLLAFAYRGAEEEGGGHQTGKRSAARDGR